MLKFVKVDVKIDSPFAYVFPCASGAPKASTQALDVTSVCWPRNKDKEFNISLTFRRFKIYSNFSENFLYKIYIEIFIQSSSCSIAYCSALLQWI